MTRRPTSFLLLSIGLACASSAGAQSVHKCADASGRISYSDMPCQAAPKPAVPAARAAAAPATTSAATPAAAARAAASPPVASVPVPSAPVASAPVARATPVDADPDVAARRDRAAQTTDCTAALRQMGVAGGGMKLVEAGNARTTALARCNGG